MTRLLSEKLVVSNSEKLEVNHVTLVPFGF